MNERGRALRSLAVAAAMSLASCLRGEIPSEPTAAPTPAPSENAASPAPTTTGSTVEATETPAPSPPLPTPYRRRREAAVSLNAGCVSCHAQVAREWRASRHRQAYTNTAFRQAFAIEPSGFCRGCHAPEAEPNREPSRAVGDLGVGCVTCHVTEEGVVLAAPLEGAGESGAAPHPLRRSADFADEGACAACHEFRFPLGHGDGEGSFMQTTVTEHRRSASAARPCAGCHMPAAGPRRSHAFALVRDPAWLRSRLSVKAERVDPRHVRLTLLQTTPGHAFPTGDLFRRLSVGGEIKDAAGKVVSRDVRYLARHFAIVPGRAGRELVRDNRIFDAPEVLELEMAQPGPVSWWVTYQRVATVGTGTVPAEARIESEVPLHVGVVP